MQSLPNPEEDVDSDSEADADSENPADSKTSVESETPVDSPSLETVVQNDPSLALSQLARILGLNFVEIKKNMELHKAVQDMRALVKHSGMGVKRSRDSSSKDAVQTAGKKVKQEMRSPAREEIPTYVTIAGVDVKVLGDPSPPRTKTASSPGHVYWAEESQSPARGKIVDETLEPKLVRQSTDSPSGQHHSFRRKSEDSEDKALKSGQEGQTSFHKGLTISLSSPTSSSRKPPRGSKSPLSVR